MNKTTIFVIFGFNFLMSPENFSDLEKCLTISSLNYNKDTSSSGCFPSPVLSPLNHSKGKLRLSYFFESLFDFFLAVDPWKSRFQVVDPLDKPAVASGYRHVTIFFFIFERALNYNLLLHLGHLAGGLFLSCGYLILQVYPQ